MSSNLGVCAICKEAYDKEDEEATWMTDCPCGVCGAFRKSC